MKRSALVKFVSLALIALLLPIVPLGSSAEGEMAYNIYADPDLSATSGKFKTFMIDFRTTDSADYTYWALANFSMQITPETLEAYPGLCYGGAYAGLQDRGPDLERAGIMSFWHWEYNKNGEMVELNASKMYPTEDDNPFGGEGTGMSSIQPFDWSDNTWYTMVLHTWTDKERGTTFTGQWFLNKTTGEWTLITYYDTHLLNSALTGGMSLFQENYWGISREDTRNFNTKGIYVLDKTYGKWKSINSATISYGDGGAANKLGAHTFGATSEYFWGSAGGSVENQSAYEAAATKYKKYTINQPSAPTLGTAEISTVTREGNTFSWTLSNDSVPQLGYKLEILDESGNVVQTSERTRPQIRSVTFDEKLPDEFIYRLSVTDIFGNTVVKETETEYYIPGNDTIEELITEEGMTLAAHDINCDNNLNISDVTSLLDYLANYPSDDFTNATFLTTEESSRPIQDVNADGQISISDVTPLLYYLGRSCNHESVISAAKDPSCSAYGFTEGSHCSICNTTLKIQKRIAKLPHNEKVVTGKAPTCTETGLTDGKTCVDCGAVCLAQQSVPATGHSYNDSGVCTDCGHSIAISIQPWFPGFENWPASSPQTNLLIIAPIAEARGNSCKWEITLDDGTTSKTVSLFTSSSYGIDGGSALFRFTPCTAIGENRFVPTPGVEYSVTARVFDGDQLIYVGLPKEGVSWILDKMQTPVVPEEAKEPAATESWALSNGVLTILSEDCMVGSALEDYPWHAYRDSIFEIVVAKGVTKVGNRAFSSCPNLRQVILGKDVSVISFDAFAYNAKLSTIVFKGKIKTIGQGTVYQTANIKRITVTGQTKEEFIALSQKAPYNTSYESTGIVWTENE